MTQAQKTLRKISDLEHAEARSIAYAACKYYYGEDDILANRWDNGWSTSELYIFSDGSGIRVDGRGWIAE